MRVHLCVYMRVFVCVRVYVCAQVFVCVLFVRICLCGMG